MIDVSRILREHADVVAALDGLRPLIEEAARRVVRCLEEGGRIFWMGNGGSAADAQHMAAEIVGRFVRERKGLPSLALTVDTSLLTAVGNDYGFDRVFARQIEALAHAGDVVVAISTSGRSANVLRGIEAARKAGAATIGLTGEGGGEMADRVDLLLAVPSRVTARIQEAHTLLAHILCEAVDVAFADSFPPDPA